MIRLLQIVFLFIGGADKINTIFGEDSHISLPKNNIKDMVDVIFDVYKNGRSSKNSSIVKKQLYTDKNLAHFLWKHFNNEE